MNYLMLLFQDPATFSSDPAAMQAEYAAYGAFTEGVRSGGAFVGGSALNPAEALGVRGTGAKTAPAAARKESLIGYYVIDATAEQAANIAGMCPAAAKGYVELIPFMAM
jgi:hypothetical protein